MFVTNAMAISGGINIQHQTTIFTIEQHSTNASQLVANDSLMYNV